MPTIESIAYRFRKVSYSVILAGTGFLLMTASFLTPSANAVTLNLQARDRDNNAVIHGGAASTDELLQKYNDKADVRAIFEHFGISPEEMQRIGSTAVAGIVTRDGNVTVDGKVVATGAMTVGRQNMSGSTAVSAGGTQFYMRPPSTSFQTERLKAFVVMTDADRNNTGGASAPTNNDRSNASGKKFAFAIIASCGNPVKATPKQPKPTPTTTKPEKPKAAQPKTLQPEQHPEVKKVPAQEQQQTQSQQQTATATANATANVTVNQPEQKPQPQPETKTVVERVEVPVPVVVQQPAQTVPAPVEELPKTGMESVNSTLGIAGLATLLGAVAHLIYTRRKLS